jgi:hypothetical protein
MDHLCGYYVEDMTAGMYVLLFLRFPVECIQNANYFGMMKFKMLICFVFMSIQNVEIFALIMAFCGSFGFSYLLRSKSKMENDNHFVKNFVWCLVLLCKMIDQNLDFFG